MAIDMKPVIAETAVKLIFEKNKKRLTVKDIAEECNITRQTFYYHFEDIPELLKWIAGQKREEIRKQLGEHLSPEDCIRFWLSMAAQTKNQIKKLESTNFWNEMQEIFFEQMVLLMYELVDQDDIDIDDAKKDFIIRYHCHATIGLMNHWTQKDTEQIDEIARNIQDIICGECGI